MGDHGAVVVGGGMAGLAAAHALAKAGARVTLVEGAPTLGGRFGTPEQVSFEHRGRTFGFPIEHGIHGVWRQYRNLRRLLGDIGAARLLAPAGEQALLHDEGGGPAVHMPVAEGPRRSLLPEPLHQLAMLSPDMLRLVARSGMLSHLRAGADIWHAWAFDPQRDVPVYDGLSVEALIGAWPTLLRRLFGALTHTGFFRDPSEVSLAAFFTGLSLYVLNDKRDTAFDVLTEDPGTAVAEPIRAVIEGAGGQVLLGTRALGVEVRDGRAVAVHVPGGVLPADAVVLAVDPPGLRALATGDLAPLLDGAAIPDGVPSHSARLWYDRAPDTATPMGVWVSEGPDAWFWLHRLQAPYRRWHQETGGGCVECHLYGRRATDVLGEPDAAVLGRVAAAVERAWPELRGRLVHSHLRRNPPTHVSFEPGIMARLPDIATFVPNLALAGDFVRAPHPVLYLERATMTGLEAARLVARAAGVERAAIPALLPPYPPRAQMLLLRSALRRARSRGLLPRLEGREVRAA